MKVLVIYDKRGRGTTEEMANAVVEGAKSVVGAEVILKPVDEAVAKDMAETHVVIIGSPNYSGMTGKIKQYLDDCQDDTGDYWETGRMRGKVGAAFTTGWSRTAGNEITMLQVLHVLWAHGMIMVGLPWSDTMRTSSSYYGAIASGGAATAEDLEQARTLGRRAVEVAVRLGVDTQDPL